VDLEAKEETLRTLGGMVEEAIAVLNRRDDLRPFRNLMHEAWLLKRSLGDKVSSGYIAEVYEGEKGGSCWREIDPSRCRKLHAVVCGPGAARGSPREAWSAHLRALQI
jgi:hypothetical protein